MNICVVCRDNVFVSKRPTHNLVPEMARAFVRAGHRVSLVLCDLPHRNSLGSIDGVKIYFHTIKPEIMILSASSRFLFRVSTYELLCARLGLVRNLRKKMLEIVQQDQIDAFVCENFLCSIPISQAIRGVPIIAAVHDVSTDSFLQKSLVYGTPKLLVKLALRWYRDMQLAGLDNADAIVFQTKQDAEYFQEMGTPKEKLFVVPSGGYTTKLSKAIPCSKDVELMRKLGIGECDPILFFCGAIAYNNNKTAENIIRVILPRVLEHLPNARMVFAGEVCDYIKRANLHTLFPKNMILAGYVDDINAFYSLYDINLLPTTNATGMQLKLADALAVGKPIICTSKAAAGYDVVSGRDLIVEDRVEDYHLHILDLLQSPRKAKSLGEHARRISHDYDWGIVMQGYNVVVDRVLATRNHKGMGGETWA